MGFIKSVLKSFFKNYNEFNNETTENTKNTTSLNDEDTSSEQVIFETKQKARLLGCILNEVTTIEKVREFESKHNVTLPEDYVWFITNVGDGGTWNKESSFSYKFYSLEEAEFSYEGLPDNKKGEDKYSLNILSRSSSKSYGIILKGEHFGKISSNEEALAYYYPTSKCFKDLYITWLNETLIGYDETNIAYRISGTVEELLTRYNKNKSTDIISSVYNKINKETNDNLRALNEPSWDLYSLSKNETNSKNQMIFAKILIKLKMGHPYMLLQKVNKPENFEEIVSEIYFEVKYFKSPSSLTGIIPDAGEYYPMLLDILKHFYNSLPDCDSDEATHDTFKYCFEMVVMNPRFKERDISEIFTSNKPFVIKYLTTTYNTIMQIKTNPSVNHEQIRAISQQRNKRSALCTTTAKKMNILKVGNNTNTLDDNEVFEIRQRAQEPGCSLNEVTEFESKHNITLPEDKEASFDNHKRTGIISQHSNKHSSLCTTTDEKINTPKPTNNTNTLDDNEVFEIRQRVQELGCYLNLATTIEKVREFERKHNVTLPEDYVWFITNIGDGGTWRNGYQFYALEKTYFSYEGLPNYKEGEEKYSLDVLSKGCSYSYGIILKGEHFGEISSNGDGLAFYDPKPIKNFKELYLTWLNETYLGYDDDDITFRIPGYVEDILNEYRENHSFDYIISIFRKINQDTASAKFMSDLYSVFINETDNENQLFLAKTLLKIKYGDPFSILQKVYRPDNYVQIVLEINLGLKYFKKKNSSTIVMPYAERYYPMLLEMLKYFYNTLPEQNKDDFIYSEFKACFKMVVMNPLYKTEDISEILTLDRYFVVRIFANSFIYDDDLKNKIGMYIKQAKVKYEEMRELNKNNNY